MSKIELFLKLANPDKDGYSRWISKTEFVGEYAPLMFKNGADWCRKESNIARKYNIKFDRSITPGRGIDRIKLDGFRTENEVIGTQSIRSDIKNYYSNQRCVILGTSKPEVDHKNGWKNNMSVMSIDSQKFEDFQPLSKAANDAKRQFCKECRRTKHRYDAKKLGYPMSFYQGNEIHDESENGCVGCFWYDPIEFRKHLIEKK